MDTRRRCRLLTTRPLHTKHNQSIHFTKIKQNKRTDPTLSSSRCFAPLVSAPHTPQKQRRRLIRRPRLHLEKVGRPVATLGAGRAIRLLHRRPCFIAAKHVGARARAGGDTRHQGVGGDRVGVGTHFTHKGQVVRVGGGAAAGGDCEGKRCVCEREKSGAPPLELVPPFPQNSPINSVPSLGQNRIMVGRRVAWWLPTRRLVAGVRRGTKRGRHRQAFGSPQATRSWVHRDTSCRRVRGHACARRDERGGIRLRG